MKFYRPLPLKKEIKINPKEFLVSKTDAKGNIIYANDTFSKVTGYSQSEVMGVAHNILRHPDMPSAIFFLMWQRIQKGENITVLIKNLTKTGEFYWVSTDFEINKDEYAKGNTYIAFRRAVPEKAIKEIETLYKTLLDIEKEHGKDASLLHLQGFLDERHMTFDQYMDALLRPTGLISTLFNTMKKRFKKVA